MKKKNSARDREYIISRTLQSKKFEALRSGGGLSFTEFCAKAGHHYLKKLPRPDLRALLQTWLNVGLDDGERAALSCKLRTPKRARSASPPTAAKRARTNGERLRYSMKEILELRHKGRMESVNAYAISRHAVEACTTSAETKADFLPDAQGRLRTSDVLLQQVPGVSTFADMHLPEPIVTALRAVGCKTPSPVQLRGIPVARLGVDVIAQAKSGTGKTIVFATIAAEASLTCAPGQIVAVVLAPTRELVRQIADVVRAVVGVAAVADGATETKVDKHEVAVLVGGTPNWRDATPLRRATVVVGTPARVRACIECGVLQAEAVRVLVLDEADRLLEECAGFDLNAIATSLPAHRQTLAFSATYTSGQLAQLRAVMRTPHLVWLGAQDDNGEAIAAWRASVLRGVRQWRVNVSHSKIDTLRKVLKARPQPCVVFARTRISARNIARSLRKGGVSATHVSAALPDTQRQAAVKRFASGEVRVIVGTDVLARGVSFENCELVVQLDVPDDVATYLHRVGRAGRFGTQGDAIVLVDKADTGNLAGIEAHIGRIMACPFVDMNAKKIDALSGASANVLDNGDVEDEVLVEADEGTTPANAHVKGVAADATLAHSVGFQHGYEAARAIIERIAAYH